ncbi:branched-chain amino acid ABC transporter permease [Actinocorallia aurea]
MHWDNILTLTIEAAFGSEAVVYALLALGLNIHFGYAGLLNFGQAAFGAIGAYGIAVSVSSFGVPFWWSLPISIIGAVLLALLLGIPTLRLRLDYLAIVTIAAAEIVRLTFKSVKLQEWFGGTDGIQRFGDSFFAANPYGGDVNLNLGFITLGFSKNDMWVITIGWILVGLVVLLTWALMRSPWGRVLKAIREDEDAVRSLGKSVFSYKMQALVLGGVIGAFSGMIFALSRQSVQADNYGTEFTFFAYTIVILGGAARVFGPVVGSMIFWVLLVFVREVLDSAVNADIIPESILTVNQTGAVVLMLVGLGLMLLLIFRPQGIFGDKREMMLDGR